METTSLGIDEIVVGDRYRQLDAEAVERLKASILSIGIKTPLSVRFLNNEDGWQLVAGRHRLQACIELGIERVPVREEAGSELDARMWEIAENLHRAELTALEHSEHVAEWIRLAADKAAKEAQLAPPLGGAQPKERGIRKAAQELGVDRRHVQRAEKIDALAQEVKDEAMALRLDDNQSALSKVAALPSKEAQVRALREHAARRDAPRVAVQSPARDPLNDTETVERQVDALMAAWNRAGPEAREIFMSRVDAPVADAAAALRAVK